MNTLIYDGTFEGWLCTVFAVYERKLKEASILTSHANQTLCQNIISIISDETKARRVWKGLCSRISANAAKQIYRSFLSEESGMEQHLLEYTRYALASRR